MRPFRACSNLLRFNLFACLWSEKRQLLTLFHTKRTHAPASSPHPGRFRLLIPQGKNLF